MRLSKQQTCRCPFLSGFEHKSHFVVGGFSFRVQSNLRRIPANEKVIEKQNIKVVVKFRRTKK